MSLCGIIFITIFQSQTFALSNCLYNSLCQLNYASYVVNNNYNKAYDYQSKNLRSLNQLKILNLNPKLTNYNLLRNHSDDKIVTDKILFLHHNHFFSNLYLKKIKKNTLHHSISNYHRSFEKSNLSYSTKQNINSLTQADFIYQSLEKYKWHRNLWVYGFWVSHLYSLSERITYFSTGEFNGILVKDIIDPEEKQYHVYTSKLSIVKDLLSIAQLFSKPYNSSIKALHYYQNTSDSADIKDQKMNFFLDEVIYEQLKPYKLKSYLIRTGFNVLFTSLVMFDLGRTDRGLKYFLSSFLLGEIKILAGPTYGSKIRRNLKTQFGIKSNPTTALTPQDLDNTDILTFSQQRYDTNLTLIIENDKVKLNYKLVF